VRPRAKDATLYQ